MIFGEKIEIRYLGSYNRNGKRLGPYEMVVGFKKQKKTLSDKILLQSEKEEAQLNRENIIKRTTKKYESNN